jgi:zinc transporter 9
MAGGESGTKAVVAAVLGNLSIAVLKLVAFVFSGSGAMLAEGIHSIADTLNQALLYLGIRLSRRPADDSHPYGYGAERYFWALVSAMGIFVLGCGVTVYHGIHQLQHPELPDVGILTWSVLAISVVVEGGVLLLAIREANKSRGGRSWREFLRTSSDPTLIAVLFEDSIAVLGVLIAAAGIGLSRITGIAYFDGIASILIGLLLGGLALLLAAKNKSLLIGQAADPRVEERIRMVVRAHPSVKKLISLRTRVLAAGEHQVDMQVDFEPNAIIDEMAGEIEEAWQGMKDHSDFDRFLRTFSDHLLDQLAQQVDNLEDRIRAEVPSVKLIDVEGD